MDNKFSQFKISKDILKAIDALGWKEPSDVQIKAIPNIIENKDIIVKSQTGSGKTGAFAIPLCEKVIWDDKEPQVLILTPTRELAIQVKEDISNIGFYKRVRPVALFGKQPFSDQTRELKQKCHIVVGTPGRVLDHIKRKTLNTSSIKYLVLDESDEMLNMGFINEVENIIRTLPKKRVTLMFSATMPQEIITLSNKHMINPVNIEIQSKKLITDNIEHSLYKVDYQEKLDFLKKLLIEEVPETAVVFCKTKENVEIVYNALNQSRISADKIHGGMLQKDRLYSMDKFRKGNFRILVATDVAARGIDVEGITHVINFDLPVEKDSYVHRIGRTGRAGANGKAISIVTQREQRLLEEIENYIGFKINEAEFNQNNKASDSLNILKTKPATKRDKSKNIKNEVTKIYLNGGKKKKIRAGDIVGAITRIDGVSGDDIGIIDVQDSVSYVDILNGKGNKVVSSLTNMTIKGKKLKVEKARK
ncbi:MAG: DEAD/DEAH box helicase [Clostridium sp.]